MDERDLVDLRTAASWVPGRAGRPPSAGVVVKRVETGVHGVRLEAVRSGGQWLTCREWVEAFLRDRGRSSR